MPKASELVQTPPKICLYGPPGSGKTALVGTLGEALCLIDIDNGARTLMKLQDANTVHRHNVEVVTILEPDPINRPVAFSEVRSKINLIMDQCAKKTFPYKVLAIDSFTSLSDACTRYVMSNSSGGKGWTNVRIEIQHWGLIFQELEQMILRLKSLPIPVIVIFHDEKNKINESTTMIELGIPGQKLPYKLPAYFDEIWYMRNLDEAGGKKSYRLQTEKNSYILARSRECLKDMFDVTTTGLRPIFEQMGVDLTMTKTEGGKPTS